MFTSFPFLYVVSIVRGEKSTVGKFLILWLFNNFRKQHPLVEVNKTNSFVVYIEIINSSCFTLL